MLTTINQISKHTDKEVTLRGWIYNIRSSGKIHFLQFRDGTGFIQLVADEGKLDDSTIEQIDDLTMESSVIIKGKVKKDDRAPSGFEMDLTDLKVIQVAEEYPIQKKEHGVDFLLDNRHLWLRSKKQWAIQRIRNTVINEIYDHLNGEGFLKIDSPILTPNACEGTTTLFPVPYLPSWADDLKDTTVDFDNLEEHDNKNKPLVFLAQSGQLYIEAAIFAHGRVFDFGPTFRAEKSKTRRHLTEFWMMDAEAAFVEHKENMKIQEKLTVAVVEKVLAKNEKELGMLDRNINGLETTAKGGFPIITHKEAIKRIQKMGSKIGERDDLGAEDETILSKEFDRPVFIEKYPKEVKAFYMKEDPEDNTRYLNNDLLAHEGYGEIIGGSQREDSYENLELRIKNEKLNIKDFQWYLDLRKYGSVPHSGFGIGLERYVAWICGLKHIRTTIPFPRLIHRVRP